MMVLRGRYLIFVYLWSMISFSNSLSLGCYVHIPFCRRRCHYCDFPIRVVGDSKIAQSRASEDYTLLLLREMDSTASTSTVDLKAHKLETVYFGGGTPSLMSSCDIGRILEKINTHFDVSIEGGGALDSDRDRDSKGKGFGTEVTMEMDPGTFDLQQIQELKSMGVNRVSLGVQSFDDSLLERSGRAHRVIDVYESLSILATAGIDDISLDLISSLPGSTYEKWHHSIAAAVQTGCPHVSVYDLQVEEGTAFGRWFKPGVFPLPSEQDSADMYRAAVSSFGTAGYEHYEVSNYAKKGYRSRHNQRYWNRVPTFGFGMAAAAYVNDVRSTRPRQMQEYRNWVKLLETVGYEEAVRFLVSQENKENEEREKGEREEEDKEKDNLDKDVDIEKVTKEEKEREENEKEEAAALEDIMLSLRTSDGLDLPILRATRGQDVVDKVKRGLQAHVHTGLVSLTFMDFRNLGLLSDTGGEAGEGEGEGNGDIKGEGEGNGAIKGEGEGNGDIKGEEVDWERVQSVRLSDPEGFLVSNGIIANVFAEFL